MKKNKKDIKNKTEIANRIANQSKLVSNVYNSVEEWIFIVIRYISTVVDNLVFSKRLMPVVALFLACFLYISINFNSESNPFTSQLVSAKTLSNVSINAIYNEESFEVSGLPETCEVILTGEGANVNNAAIKNGNCQVNLDGLTEGIHNVELNAVGYGDTVNASVNPTSVTVELKRKKTAEFKVDYDYVNTDKLENKYILSEPEFIDGNKVSIRASQDTLNSIAFVKVLIDVSNVAGDFEAEAPLVAYDALGNVVKANIIPEKVKVKVKVTSPHKTVPIVLNATGDVPSGMAIESITLDKQSTTIYGNDEVLKGVESVNINLDASSLTRDTQMAVPITLPSGVTSADVTQVNLNVKLGKSVTKTINDVSINYRNNDNNYSLKVENNQTKVDVDVIGTENNVENFTADDIYVYIDMKDLKPGTYDLPLLIQSSNGSGLLKYNLKNLTIKVEIIGESDKEEIE